MTSGDPGDWRPGARLLGFSSAGELRDLGELTGRRVVLGDVHADGFSHQPDNHRADDNYYSGTVGPNTNPGTFTQNFALATGARVIINVTNPDNTPGAAQFYDCEWATSGGFPVQCGGATALASSCSFLVSANQNAYSVGIWDPNHDYALIDINISSVVNRTISRYDVQFGTGNVVKGVVTAAGVPVDAARVSLSGADEHMPASLHCPAGSENDLGRRRRVQAYPQVAGRLATALVVHGRLHTGCGGRERDHGLQR